LCSTSPSSVKNRAPSRVIATISPFVDQLHAARLGEERRDRRREVHLAVSDADDEADIAAARPDEQARARRCG
jgi:hypothetical protein